MVLKSYIFALDGSAYQQYVSDYSASFLKKNCVNCTEENQIAIHRDGNLIFYAYMHKVSESEIYGLCVVCSEVCLNIEGMCDFLERLIENQAKKGIVFKYDESGKIRRNIKKFSDEPAEIANIFQDIKLYLDSLDSCWEILPPENFSIPISSTIKLSIKEDDKIKIISAIKKYHNILITLNNSVPSSYSRTVDRLNKENKKLLLSNNNLKSELSKLTTRLQNPPSKGKTIVYKRSFWILLVVFAFTLALGLNYYLDQKSSYETKIDGLDAQLKSAKKLIANIQEVVNEYSISKEITFHNWTSSNHDKSTTDEKIYNFEASVGDILMFNYDVDSESYDHFICYLIFNGEENIIKDVSGTNRHGSVRYTINRKGKCQIKFCYKKDSSVDIGRDNVSISNILIERNIDNKLNDLLREYIEEEKKTSEKADSLPGMSIRKTIKEEKESSEKIDSMPGMSINERVRTL